ncbi:hypothetical protein [Caulobacter sp. NIBR2454]|uniref:hypothetical protein n=1 Tax=Caulobacter sp. NIBR2454 TaxID=3015996 RepID=UPI0022B61F92|nr:hypothetical protein [Caulobacter sp. NIBR2454]
MRIAILVAAIVAAPAVATAAGFAEYVGTWTQKDGPSGPGSEWRIEEGPGTYTAGV